MTSGTEQDRTRHQVEETGEVGYGVMCEEVGM